jgi:hypothetical protein
MNICSSRVRLKFDGVLREIERKYSKEEKEILLWKIPTKE